MSNKQSLSELVLVITTEKDKGTADRLAKILLNEKLAGCISHFEVNSSYLWHGSIEESKEVKMIIKTRQGNLRKLISRIESMHSYEVPELIYFSAVTSEKYLEWLDDSMG